MLNNYTGEVDPKALRPKHGTSYLEYSDLKPIVDLANAWRYGDMQEALKDLRTVDTVDQEIIHLSYMLEAEVFITHNLFPEALERLTIFLDKYPNDLQALFLAAAVSAQLENEYEKLHYLEKLEDVCQPLANIFRRIVGFVNEHIGQVDLEERIPEGVAFDAIVLYGNRMEEDGSMSEALERRLEKTLELLEKYPNAKLLASGGAALTPFSESDAMTEWLTDRGVARERIYMDEFARDTVGNIIGYEMLLKEYDLTFDHYCCVTSLSHLARAWMGFVVGMERHEVPFESIHAAAPEAPNSIEVPEIERFFTLFTVIRSAEWLERKKFIEFGESVVDPEWK